MLGLMSSKLDEKLRSYGPKSVSLSGAQVLFQGKKKFEEARIDVKSIKFHFLLGNARSIGNCYLDRF